MCRDKDGSILTDDREVTERWKQHFKEHLNGVQEEDKDSEGDVVGAAEDGYMPPPTIGEVKDAVKRLKNNKSASKDGIGAELIKMGPDKLAECLHRLIAKIWDTEQLPEEWKDGVICPIYKTRIYPPMDADTEAPTLPPTTLPPITQPPTTLPPTTLPPITQPPTTQPPITQPPTTQPPITQPPTTLPPITQPPTTQPPITQPPTTQPPITQPPTTQPPITQPPTTQPPITQPPTTQPPITQPPTTQPPITQPPITQPPTTQPPTTEPPTTPTPGCPICPPGICKPDDRCPIDPCLECDPILLPHPDDCGKFLKCTHGYACEMHCPPGLHWSSALNRCEWPSNGDCAGGGIPTGPPADDGCPFDERCILFGSSKDPILLPHPDQCTQFVSCISSQHGCVKDCPGGLHWSVTMNRCEWPNRAGCDPSFPPIDDCPTCPCIPCRQRQDLHPCVKNSYCSQNFNASLSLPYHKNCGQFFKCLNGFACLLDCPYGTHYSSQSQNCLDPKIAQCILN